MITAYLTLHLAQVLKGLETNHIHTAKDTVSRQPLGSSLLQSLASSRFNYLSCMTTEKHVDHPPTVRKALLPRLSGLGPKMESKTDH